MLKKDGVIADERSMAAPALPDFDALALRLVQLEHREGDAERRVVKLQDRYATFPSEMGERQVEEAHRTLLVMRREMNDLRAQLLPIMRLRDPG